MDAMHRSSRISAPKGRLEGLEILLYPAADEYNRVAEPHSMQVETVVRSVWSSVMAV